MVETTDQRPSLADMVAAALKDDDEDGDDNHNYHKDITERLSLSEARAKDNEDNIHNHNDADDDQDDNNGFGIYVDYEDNTEMADHIGPFCLTPVCYSCSSEAPLLKQLLRPGPCQNARISYC